MNEKPPYQRRKVHVAGEMPPKEQMWVVGRAATYRGPDKTEHLDGYIVKYYGGDKATVIATPARVWGGMVIGSDMQTGTYGVTIDPWYVTWYGADGVLRRGYVDRAPVAWERAEQPGSPTLTNATYQIPFYPPVSYIGSGGVPVLVSVAYVSLGRWSTGAEIRNTPEWVLPTGDTGGGWYTFASAPVFSSVLVPGTISDDAHYTVGFQVYEMPALEYQRARNSASPAFAMAPTEIYAGSVTFSFIGTYYNGPDMPDPNFVMAPIDALRHFDRRIALRTARTLNMKEVARTYVYSPYLSPVDTLLSSGAVTLPQLSAPSIGGVVAGDSAVLVARAARGTEADRIIESLKGGVIFRDVEVAVKTLAPAAPGADLAWGKPTRLHVEVIDEADHKIRRIVRLWYEYIDANGDVATDSETYTGTITLRSGNHFADAAGRAHTVARYEVSGWPLFPNATEYPLFDQPNMEWRYTNGFGGGYVTAALADIAASDAERLIAGSIDAFPILRGDVYVDTTQLDRDREVLTDFHSEHAPIYLRWRERFQTARIPVPTGTPEEDM